MTIINSDDAIYDKADCILILNSFSFGSSLTETELIAKKDLKVIGDKGHIPAMFKLAFSYKYYKQYDNYKSWMEKAALEGDVRAMMYMAQYYMQTRVYYSDLHEASMTSKEY